ncbi:MAG: ATP-dependent RNA helicase HrpA [Ilumatobacteraceae bacterium]
MSARTARTARTGRTDSAVSDAATVELRRARRQAIVAEGRLRYPDELPITARRDDLLAAIRDHQVVVVAGETGSGKSTQLPKMVLELGRGVDGVIGHTQPRRVAARTIAERVAEELGSAVGEDVGFSVRFDDRVGDGTLVRVMTDGILLAELSRDPDLRRYDTLIIDEAHERSLNIDFILGYLRRLLPRRPDLTLIVTSATIDTARFAEHFADVGGTPAPIIEVTGRTYPVEVRYRPFGEDPDDDRDQVQAVVDAIDELGREGPGDVLVFLSGEREIHDTADALRRRADHGPPPDVLPLYARLSNAEQHRIFQPHRGRRIVLSTNVAETSITVPGVRYVVDAGTARVSRYSRRLKVQRLPIEPISQASADQRAGRCGRVAAGICIRLYGEEDLAARPPFTQPEILRTNLASVILQMTALGIGDVASFPFVEPPDAASVRDGYLLLEELGALVAHRDGDDGDDGGGRLLTRLGRRLARLPVDPRLGRMILEAERHGCVREVLVVAAALSIRDPRERPEDHRQAADEMHRRFDVPGSDLLTLVALWDHLREQQRALSSNQFRKLCRTEHLNYVRVREWQDLVRQLRHAAADLGVRAGAEAGHPDHVHQSVLTGLLSHVGMRDREGRQFKGARGATFTIAAGSVLTKRSPRWVMAAELVETNRIWARRVAAIDPAWVERAATHLVRRSYGEPRWDARRGAAVTTETVTLFGLPVVEARTIPLDRVDPAAARQMFVRHALVDGEWSPSGGSLTRFVDHNREYRRRVRDLEARVRRHELLDDVAVHEFYDARIAPGVTSTRHFERWWKGLVADDPGLLELTDDILEVESGIHAADFPDRWRDGDLDLPLTYRFDPGGPLDGVTVHVPLTALNQFSGVGLDWQIPGYRADLVGAMVRTLPKDVRRQLIPAAETTHAAFERLGPVGGRFVDALAAALRDVSGARVPAEAFRPDTVPAHLRMNIVVSDASGAVHDADDDLGAIRRRLAASARAAIAEAAPIDERRGIVDWDVGTVPQVVESSGRGLPAIGYPALLDDDDSVSLRVLTNPDLQQRVMRGGVRRLLLLTAPPPTADVLRGLDQPRRLAVAASAVDLDALVADCRVLAVDAVLAGVGELPWDADAFEDIRRRVRRDGPGLAASAMAVAADALAVATAVRRRLERLVAPAVAVSVADAATHLDRLVGRGFVLRAGPRHLNDVLRFTRGLEFRLDRLAEDVGRDRRRMAEVVPLEERYVEVVRRAGRGRAPADLVEIGWQLEELRISVFAQPLGAHGSPSPTKLRRRLDAYRS